VQLTLYYFQSQTHNQENLLLTSIVLITIPMLIMYIFFNREIMAGMTSGPSSGSRSPELGRDGPVQPRELIVDDEG
jgi:hypothetical protein